MNQKVKSIINNFYNKGQYLTKFLNSSEVEILLRSVSAAVIYSTDGGYSDSKRKRVFLGSNSNDLNVTIIKVEPLSKFYKLKHPTVKWTFLNMGISEDMFGDILEVDNYFLVVVCSEIVDIVCKEIESIARVKVKLSEYEGEVVKEEKEILKAFCKTLRIDNVISKTFHLSRSKGQNFIDNDIVVLNDVEINKFTKKVVVGDEIKVRGKGKIVVKNITQNEKTQRYILEYVKYGR